MYSSLAKIQQRLASCSFTKALPVIALAAMLTLPFWSLNGHRWIIHTYSLVLFPLLVSLFFKCGAGMVNLKDFSPDADHFGLCLLLVNKHPVE
jgi:hypothetical protein